MPWRASEPLNSSCITSTSWSTRHVGQLERGVGHRVLDDAIGESVAGAVEGVGLETGPDVGLERRQVRELAHGSRAKSSSTVGLDLLAQLLDLDAEVGDLAGQRRLPVVLGEGDVELGRLTGRPADRGWPRSPGSGAPRRG